MSIFTLPYAIDPEERSALNPIENKVWAGNATACLEVTNRG